MADLNPHYRDDCDRCPVRFNSPAPAPLLAIPDGPDGMIAAYCCPQCGGSWTTGWALVPGRPIPPAPTGREPFPLNHLAALLFEQAAIARAGRHLRGPNATA